MYKHVQKEERNYIESIIIRQKMSNSCIQNGCVYVYITSYNTCTYKKPIEI